MVKALELSGQVFHRLTVIERISASQCQRQESKWLCQCSCGKFIETYGSFLKRGLTKSCGCLSADLHYKGYKDISGTYWAALQRGATKRNLSFEISMEFVWNLYESQNRQCALTGMPIFFQRNKNIAQDASIDRINNSVGYTESNIWIVHKKVNFMKGQLGLEDFMDICRRIVNNGKSSSKMCATTTSESSEFSAN